MINLVTTVIIHQWCITPQLLEIFSRPLFKCISCVFRSDLCQLQCRAWRTFLPVPHCLLQQVKTFILHLISPFSEPWHQWEVMLSKHNSVWMKLNSFVQYSSFNTGDVIKNRIHWCANHFNVSLCFFFMSQRRSGRLGFRYRWCWCCWSSPLLRAHTAGALTSSHPPHHARGPCRHVDKVNVGDGTKQRSKT